MSEDDSNKRPDPRGPAGRRTDRIPAEQLTAYERWELPVMDQAGTTTHSRRPRTEDMVVKPLTAQQLEAIRQDAWAEGQQEGHAEGLKKGHDEGFQKGHAEGYQQGLAKGMVDGEHKGEQSKRADIDAAIKRLGDVAQDLMDPIRRHQDDVEQALLNLALAVSRSVIRRELSINSEQIRQVVREAMNSLPRSSELIRLHVNPQDAPLVKELAQQQQENWVIVEAPDLLPGGCRVETRHSLVDYTVEKRFQLAVQQMLDRHIAVQAADDSQDLTDIMNDMTDFHRELLEPAAAPVAKPAAAPVAEPATPPVSMNNDPDQPA